MDSALRPRDIQARIRAGESPEDVAAAAQTSVDAIMPFAGPVIAERAARRPAPRSRRRCAGPPADSTSPRTLGEAAELFFGEHSLHDEDVEWDAWRRADGRWALVATYAVGGKPRTRRVHPRPAGPLRGGRQRRRPDPHRRAACARPGRRTRSPAGAPAQLGATPRTSCRSATTPSSWSATPSRAAVADEVVDPTADTADADWLADPTPAPDDVPLLEEPDADEHADEPVDQPSTTRPRRRSRNPCETDEDRRRPRLRGHRRGQAGLVAAQGPLLGPVVGRDHVRRQRQGRLTAVLEA